MNTARRKKLSAIMCGAWALSRYGAERFGGTAFLYFAIALRLVWFDEKNPRYSWRRGVGLQFVLPCVEVRSPVIQKQLRLFGSSK